MKKTAKNNDQNDQISALFGIFRQVSEKKIICKMYIVAKITKSSLYLECQGIFLEKIGKSEIQFYQQFHCFFISSEYSVLF